MNTVLVCRVCLRDNIRMEFIENSDLLEFFQLLADNRLSTEDRRPEALCYMCYAQLQQCWRFMQRCRKAEKILRLIKCNSLKITPEVITQLNGGSSLVSPLQVQPTSVHSYDDNDDNVKCFLIDIKQECEAYPIDFNNDCLDDVKLNDDDLSTFNEAPVLIKDENLQNLEQEENDLSIDIKDEDEDSTGSLADINEMIPTVSLKKFRKKAKEKSSNKISKKENTWKGCGIILADKYDYQTHMQTHKRGERPFACNVCGKTFKKKSGMIRHMKIHTGVKPFACHLCPKKFYENYQLQNHKNGHDGQIFNCDLCSKTFLEKRLLKRHIKRIHYGLIAKPYALHSEERRKPDFTYACDFCGKTCIDKTVLTNHLRTHTGEKPYGCDMCHKTFNEKGNLIRHIRIHTKEKPYTCNICYKSFSESGNLKTHKRVHTVKKPFSYEACGKSFAESKSLKNHLTTYTGERQCCSICYKTFTSKSSLKCHLKIHSGEKPYSCDICNKKFNESGLLSRHKRTHVKDIKSL